MADSQPDHPPFLYGTAWKEERTEALTRLALENGFRGIDTANQRKHYHEAGVGQALRSFLAENQVPRSALFLQSKYTYQAGQDHRLPYDPQASFSTQVAQSFASSLEHLGTDYLDAYLLHGPASRQGLTHADREVWQAMEKLQLSGQARHLGVSNISAAQLQALLQEARVKPRFVQNRCYAVLGWDAEVRALCQREGLVYQGFSLLTANGRELSQPWVQTLAHKHGATLPQLVFAFALQKGMLPLTGTSSAQHMREDLAAPQFTLSPEEVQTLGVRLF